MKDLRQKIIEIRERTDDRQILGDCESLENMFKQRIESIEKQKEIAWENVERIRQYFLENNELPEVEDYTDLFERGFLRGLETALDILSGKLQNKWE